jgi:predicted lipid-binding transport protein (Tim44 family)
MRGLAGGLFGGFLGAMLFSSFAEAGWGGFGGSGFGLIEILLLAGLGYLIFRMIRKPALATGYSPAQYQSTGYSSSYGTMPAPETPTVDEPDFNSIRILDPSFRPDQFVKSAQDIFFKAQAGWSRNDPAGLTSLCRPELARAWEQELAELRARGQSNRIENIALRATEITEAWTEQGQDYVTVRFEANLFDYTVDEKSGAVVSGSKSEPVAFEEFWTFSRPVGPNPWKLTAVQQA